MVISPPSTEDFRPVEAFASWLETQPHRAHLDRKQNRRRARRYRLAMMRLVDEFGVAALEAPQRFQAEGGDSSVGRTWQQRMSLTAVRAYCAFTRGMRGEAGEMRSEGRVPVSLRRALWLRDVGPLFRGHCRTPWCRAVVDVLSFHAGHCKARSKGGRNSLDNLVVLCPCCNASMGTEDFADWSGRGAGAQPAEAPASEGASAAPQTAVPASGRRQVSRK